MSEKVSKDSVGYTSRAMKLHERCRYCEHFDNTGTLYGVCAKVAGNISPQGWCELFKRSPA